MPPAAKEENEALEFQANQAYEALKRAASTKEYLDVSWAGNSFCSLYWSLKRAAGVGEELFTRLTSYSESDMEKEITQRQIDALEFQANQAYEALKRAASTKQFLDAFWVHNLYCSLEWSLKEAAGVGKDEFLTRCLERGHPLERYILQYAIGFNLAFGLRYRPTETRPQQEIAEHEEFLRIALEGKEHPVYSINDSYERIFIEAEFLGTYAEADNFKKIFDVMESIREKYPKPKIE